MQFDAHHVFILALPVNGPVTRHLPLPGFSVLFTQPGFFVFGRVFVVRGSGPGVASGGDVYPPKALATAPISGYFPSLHWLPLKSSKSRHQNMAPPRPLAEMGG